MKITDIKAYTLDAYRTNWTFIKVMTDEGLYGWGEASLGTRENALEGCVEDLKRLDERFGTGLGIQSDSLESGDEGIFKFL